MTEVTRDPGLRWIVAPTTGWRDRPPGFDAWHWARYAPLGDGRVRRDHGFCATREGALAEARR